MQLFKRSRWRSFAAPVPQPQPGHAFQVSLSEDPTCPCFVVQLGHLRVMLDCALDLSPTLCFLPLTLAPGCDALLALHLVLLAYYLLACPAAAAVRLHELMPRSKRVPSSVPWPQDTKTGEAFPQVQCMQQLVAIATRALSGAACWRPSAD